LLQEIGGIDMKKWMYLVIACLSITLIGYSVMAYANETPANASKEVNGFFVALEGQSNIQIQTTNGIETIELAKSVWVYRNQQKANLTDLKAKDQLELILNGKLQAAYIKAKSLDAAATAPSPTPEPTMGVSPTPEPAATATPTPEATVTQVPASTKQASSKQDDNKRGKANKKSNDHGDNHGRKSGDD
jgi:hypothetical protein